MKTGKFFIITVWLALFAAACTSMDENYKDFVEGGPETYLTKLAPEDITITGERNKAHVIMPKMKDPRAKQVRVYWANKTKDTVQTLNRDAETPFNINNLEEGTYIFEFVLMDDAGNKSLATPVTATVYGSIYEAYLMNRPVTSYEKDSQTGKLKLDFAEVREKTMLNTEIVWSENGTVKTAEADTIARELELNGFNAHSFSYRTAYKPGQTDTFYSAWSYFTMIPDPEEIVYDRTDRKFTFPDLSADDHWIGYEMTWTDRISFETLSETLDGYEYQNPEYRSAEFQYSVLFDYNGQTLKTRQTSKATASRDFLDRSNWYVPLETETSTGRELANVMDGSWTAAAAAIAAKTKSPYLSQKLPWSNSATTDGLNYPRAHIDGDNLTYLSMIKGPGTSFEAGGNAHTNGGVSSNDAGFGNEVYFIIDLGAEEEFDYFRIVYRINGSGAATLRPQQVLLFGSNDPACISDQTVWEQITPNKVVLPKNDVANTGSDPNHENNHTGNVNIPFSRYRYVKCRYTDWQLSSQSMQITEFYLGGTVY
ncbi:MAG: DUF4998 domain-containing protein [Prevotellaceae bacterium]|jgi:hypothetical protein|nr:DUF4998 domain-containing protein [Prevotellaceae bacterium]